MVPLRVVVGLYQFRNDKRRYEPKPKKNTRTHARRMHATGLSETREEHDTLSYRNIT